MALDVSKKVIENNRNELTDDFRFPKDGDPRKISSRSEAILHYKIDSNCWIYRNETERDFGRDCILELVENDCFMNNKIEGQIKGAKKPNFISNHKYISQSVETKTISYALGCPYSFVLFVVDITSEKVYFQCIQEYFETRESEIDKLKKQKYINIRVPVTNCINNNDENLKALAIKRYF